MKHKNSLESFGIHLARYALVVVLVWIGAMKFTPVEAEAIEPLVANSPILSWSYDYMNVEEFSMVLGALELFIALLIALRPVFPGGSAFGSWLAVLMFLTTLSFIGTTPGWEPDLGFPMLSVTPGQFLLKDVVLLGVALLTAGEAHQGSRNRRHGTAHEHETTRQEDMSGEENS